MAECLDDCEIDDDRISELPNTSMSASTETKVRLNLINIDVM